MDVNKEIKIQLYLYDCTCADSKIIFASHFTFNSLAETIYLGDVIADYVYAWFN